MARRRALAAFAVLGAAVLPIAGCGGGDFKNDPRPPIPLEVTVEVNDEAVQVAPSSFGAGLVNFVIANTSRRPAVFALRGPVDGRSDPIPARGNAVFKIEMKSGTYVAAVLHRELIKTTRLEVGPERESAQNDLLLP